MRERSPGGRRYHSNVLPSVVPQLVANDGAKALRQANADPDRFACEPKVDGVRGLVVYQPGRVMEMRNRRGERRDWLRGDAFEAGLRRLADRLPLPWQERRERLELLAGAFDVPLELSPLVDPSVSLVEQMTDGRLEGIVLKDRTSTYRDGTRTGWWKVKDRSWYEREAWRFDRR